MFGKLSLDAQKTLDAALTGAARLGARAVRRGDGAGPSGTDTVVFTLALMGNGRCARLTLPGACVSWIS